MRYFGGGIGHLKNTPPQQVHEDLGTVVSNTDELGENLKTILCHGHARCTDRP